MDAFDIADWRDRVFELYAAARAAESPEAGHALWRIERDRLFVEHPASPLLPEDRAAFSGLPIPDYDPLWRFEVELEPAGETTDGGPMRWEVQTGTDGVVPFERLGTVRIPGLGSLDVWRLASYGGGLFIPVKDASAGKPGGTYGGGRYLVDTVKGAWLGAGAEGASPNRALVLDFNFAYNPSCAYDPAWACPLAPLGNTIASTIPVGELYGV